LNRGRYENVNRSVTGTSKNIIIRIFFCVEYFNRENINIPPDGLGIKAIRERARHFPLLRNGYPS